MLLCLSACNVPLTTEECAHNLRDSWTVAPTCDSEGYTMHKCGECGAEYRTDFKAPLGHTFTESTVAPTCDAPGYTNYRCACGYEYKSHFLPPVGHDLHATVTAPTCDEQGYTTYACSACKYTYAANYEAPLGHSFDKTVTLPTSTATGYTLFSCPCGYEYKGDYVMSGDIYKGAYVDGTEILAHGVDISAWNGEIDWTALREAGVDFVMIKAGSSLGMDKKFEEYYSRARSEGFGVGCYFYTYASNLLEIEEDAALFMQWLDGKQFDYPVYLDLEEGRLADLAPTLLTDMVKLFIETLQANRYFCGLYVNNDWLINRLDTERVTTWFDIWYARWTLSGEPVWPDSFGAKRMGIWQYSSQGKIGTHECTFDLNVAYKDYPTLIKSLGYNGYPVAD